MDTIFKYNANAKYSTKDLKGAYNSSNFSLLNVYLDEKGTSVKIQLLTILNDHHIIAKTTTVGDEWLLSLALWRNFYNSHGKHKPELNEYFHVLKSVKFCRVLFHKCTWYFLATSPSSELTCTQCL